MISAIVLSLLIGAALGAIAMGIIKDRQCEHYLTEIGDLTQSPDFVSADYERLRAITEQPEGACVQLVQIGNASTSLGRPI